MEYITNMWHIIDFVTNSLYIATFTTKIVAFLIVSWSAARWQLSKDELEIVLTSVSELVF